MNKHEGIVTSLTAEDKAEVLIRPGAPGIPGAPELSKKVCHTATDGSTVRIEVLNRVGAGVGDWVSLSRKAGVARRNAGALLGIPLLGALLGLVVAVILTKSLATNIVGWVICVAIGLLFGIIMGHGVYRRISAHNQIVIGQVIRSASEMVSEFGDVQSRMEKAGATCRDCTQCLPSEMAKDGD
ncbi:MAG: SoxR reducing system RseC family protein [Deltaproteobacteria bacterium]|nr:SoxR reducing system RseC family protein [Deltaproteobacteria bacterium]